jgi:hypothetical protein
MSRKLMIVGVGTLLAGVTAVAVLFKAANVPDGVTHVATASVHSVDDMQARAESPAPVDESLVPAAVTMRPRSIRGGATPTSSAPSVFDALMTTPTSPFESDMVKALAGNCGHPFVADEDFAGRIAQLEDEGSGAGRDLTAAVESAYRQGFATVGGGDEVIATCGVYLCAVSATLAMPPEDDLIWEAVVNRLLGHSWRIATRMSPGAHEGMRTYRTIFSLSDQWGRISRTARTPAGRQTSEMACRSFFPNMGL